MAQVVKRMTQPRIDPTTGKVTRKADVRYDVRWRLNNRTANKTFRRLEDANNFIRQIGADELRGVVADPRRAKVTVREVADQWVAATTTKRVRSVERDRIILNRHVLPAIGDRRVSTVTRADLQALIDQWTTAGQAPSTIGRQFSCLRALLSYAEAAEIIYRAPTTRGMRLPQVSLVKRPQLSAEQLQSLADALGVKAAPMMWVGVVLGLRWSEAAGLRIRDFDEPGGRISVAGQLSREGTHEPPKSAAGLRTLAVPDWLVDMIAGLAAGTGDDLIFTSESGQPLRYTNWRRRVWVPSCRQAGLDGLRFHDLRSMAGHSPSSSWR